MIAKRKERKNNEQILNWVLGILIIILVGLIIYLIRNKPNPKQPNNNSNSWFIPANSNNQQRTIKSKTRKIKSQKIDPAMLETREEELEFDNWKEFDLDNIVMEEPVGGIGDLSRESKWEEEERPEWPEFEEEPEQGEEEEIIDEVEPEPEEETTEEQQHRGYCPYCQMREGGYGYWYHEHSCPDVLLNPHEEEEIEEEWE